MWSGSIATKYRTFQSATKYRSNQLHGDLATKYRSSQPATKCKIFNSTGTWKNNIEVFNDVALHSGKGEGENVIARRHRTGKSGAQNNPFKMLVGTARVAVVG